MEISNNSVLFQEEIVIKLFLTSPKKVLFAKTPSSTSEFSLIPSSTKICFVV